MNIYSDNLDGKTIVLISNSDFSFYYFRRPLIKLLISHGAKVFLVSPEGIYRHSLEDLGADFISWKVHRTNINPLRELRAIVDLCQIIHTIKPDIIHNYTIKASIYGSLASFINGVPKVISTITGMGYVFTSSSFKASVLKFVVTLFLRITLAKNDYVCTLNRHDEHFLIDKGIIKNEKTYLMDKGEGVDTEYFSPQAATFESIETKRKEIGLSDQDLGVLFIGRLLYTKGLREFVKSAEYINKRNKKFKFIVVGPDDKDNPESVSQIESKEWFSQSYIKYIGERNDIRDLMLAGDLVVLPSYREGVPQILLEAASMGKAIVASNIDGVRNVVSDGINGLLAEPRDVCDLTKKILLLLEDDLLRCKFGLASRAKAELEFNSEIVNYRLIKIYTD